MAGERGGFVASRSQRDVQRPVLESLPYLVVCVFKHLERHFRVALLKTADQAGQDIKRDRRNHTDGQPSRHVVLECIHTPTHATATVAIALAILGLEIRSFASHNSEVHYQPDWNKQEQTSPVLKSNDSPISERRLHHPAVHAQGGAVRCGRKRTAEVSDQ